MQPEFGLVREQANQLYLGDGENPRSKFHFHSQIELYFINEGKVEVWINDKQQILKEGELSVALSYDAHRYQTLSESKASCLIIPTDLCGEFLTSIENKQVCNPFIKDRQAFDQLKACYSALQTSDNKLKNQGLIYVLLGILLEQLDLEERHESVDPQLSTQLLFYINKNFKNNLSLPSIAADLGYNPSYLSRYFKNCFNIGINQYLTMIRLRKAILLMKERKYDITYCALESGFNSMRTFYRAFYQEFQCPPKEYLQKINK